MVLLTHRWKSKWNMKWQLGTYGERERESVLYIYICDMYVNRHYKAFVVIATPFNTDTDHVSVIYRCFGVILSLNVHS